MVSSVQRRCVIDTNLLIQCSQKKLKEQFENATDLCGKKIMLNNNMDMDWVMCKK